MPPRNLHQSPLDTNHPDYDFFSCPPTVQRKYFSSLERLRIARQTPGSRPKSSKSASSHSKVTSPRVPSPLSPRPGLARRNSSYFKNPASLWARKTSSPISESFSLSDAQWYKTLPSKVQRGHFTEEERNFLSGQNPDAIIPDAADLRLYELSRYLETNHSLPSLHTAFSTLSSPRSSISTFEAVDDMDDAMMDTFHCLDQDDDLDLASTLDDYHKFYAPKPSRHRMSKHHPSFRKVMSLSSIPFAAASQPPPLPTKSAATASPTPQQPNTPSSPTFPKHSLNFPRPQPRPTHKPHASTTTLEPEAIHYQDPSARMKLRVYLGSPQKFDEAIEFGFPSVEDAEARPMSRPSLSNRRFATAPPSASNEKTFLDDSTPSVFDALDDASSSASDYSEEDEVDEVASLPERNSPYTPTDAHFSESYLLSPSVASQPSSTSATFSQREKDMVPPPITTSIPVISKPIIRRDPSEPLAQVLAGNREMTLRMTLTRPDLRADENVLYPHPQMPIATDRSGSSSKAKNSAEELDPLALEQLPNLREKGGLDIWDTLPPVKQSGFRRMWRRVSGKNS